MHRSFLFNNNRIDKIMYTASQYEWSAKDTIRGYVMLREIYRLIYFAQKKSDPFGDMHRFKNDIFEVRPYDECTCGAKTPADVEPNHKPNCPARLPNFKCGDLEIWLPQGNRERILANKPGLSESESSDISWACENSLIPLLYQK